VRGRLFRQFLALQQRDVRQSGGRATPGRAAPHGRRRLLVPFTAHVRHDTVDGTGKSRSRPTLLMPPELGPVAGELRVLARRLLTARGRAGLGWGERPGAGHATATGWVGAVPQPAEQRAHHDPTGRDPCASIVSAKPGADGVGATELGAGLSSRAVGGSVVTDRQEQAVLAMVRLIKDQDVEVTARAWRPSGGVVRTRRPGRQPGPGSGRAQGRWMR
jgi:hypothetical protein